MAWGCLEKTRCDHLVSVYPAVHRELAHEEPWCCEEDQEGKIDWQNRTKRMQTDRRDQRRTRSGRVATEGGRGECKRGHKIPGSIFRRVREGLSTPEAAFDAMLELEAHERALLLVLEVSLTELPQALEMLMSNSVPETQAMYVRWSVTGSKRTPMSTKTQSGKLS